MSVNRKMEMKPSLYPSLGKGGKLEMVCSFPSIYKGGAREGFLSILIKLNIAENILPEMAKKIN